MGFLAQQLVIDHMSEDPEERAAMDEIGEGKRMTLKFRQPLQREPASGSHGG